MIGRFTHMTPAAVVIATLGLLGGTTARAEEAKDPNTGAISVSAGVEVTNFYFFRGIAQENEGAIVQPTATVNFTVFQSEGTFSKLDLFVGVWNSLHSGPTGSSGAPGDIWYEADIYAGLTASIDKFTASLTYTAYTSPNNFFFTINEIAVKVAYDDSELWKGVNFAGFAGLKPYALIAFEFDGQADIGNAPGTAGTNEGIYLELGIAPTFTIVASEAYPITLSLPLTVGLSIDDYYEDQFGADDTFGYVSIGAVLSVPLAFIPDQFGEWSFYAGVSVFILGDTTQNLANAFTTGGESWEVVGKVGISFSY